MTNWLTNTLVATVAVTGSMTDAAGKATDDKTLLSQVEAFREAGDARDTSRLEQILHASFRLYAFMGEASEGVTMDKKAYLGAMTAGKLGGSKRSLDVVSLEVRGNTAVARIRMRSSLMRFDTYMQWIFIGGRWQLLNDLTNAEAPK